MGNIPGKGAAALDRQQSNDAEKSACHQVETWRQGIPGPRYQPCRDERREAPENRHGYAVAERDPDSARIDRK